VFFSFQHRSACCAGPFTAWQVALPTKAIHVKAADNNASVAAAAAVGSAAAGGSGHLGAPPTPLQTPPYSALRTPRTPVLLDAFGKGDSTITHFAPPETKLAVDHTLKTLGLAFNMYETFLGCKFPYKALQTVSSLSLFYPGHESAAVVASIHFVLGSVCYSCMHVLNTCMLVQTGQKLHYALASPGHTQLGSSLGCRHVTFLSGTRISQRKRKLNNAWGLVPGVSTLWRHLTTCIMLVPHDHASPFITKLAAQLEKKL